MLLVLIVILIVGFAALVKGADIFVDGSSGLARLFHIPGLIIGLTVVAFGTSAPELAVSTTAALQGSNEIALSNVTGSNIFNLLMVLGICSCVKELPVDDAVRRRDFPVSIIAALAALIAAGFGFLPVRIFSMAMSDNAGTIGRAAGILLLILFVLYIIMLIRGTEKSDEDEAEDVLPLWKCLLMIVFGLVLIVAGGQAVVYSARNIAREMGLTETLIGLTIVAVGTSLPELVTSIVAAGKGETSMAVGNVVGSNIFNMLLILGISSSIHPVTANVASVYDLIILIVVSLLTWGFSFSDHSVRRGEGIIMVLCYVAYIAFAVIR